MPPAREDRAAWLRLLTTDNDAINVVHGRYRPDRAESISRGSIFARRISRASI